MEVKYELRYSFIIEHSIVHLVQKLNDMYPNFNFLFKADSEHIGGSCKIRFKLKKDESLCLFCQL